MYLLIFELKLKYLKINLIINTDDSISYHIYRISE